MLRRHVAAARLSSISTRSLSLGEALQRSESFCRRKPGGDALRIDSGASLASAARHIVDAEQPLLVVTGDRVVGVVTEREILRGAVRGATSVSDVFLPMQSITPNTPIHQALKLMVSADLLPVADPESGQTSLLTRLDLLAVQHDLLKEAIAESTIHDG